MFLTFGIFYKRSIRDVLRKMPLNVEIKATIRDYDQFRSLAENVSGQKGLYFKSLQFNDNFVFLYIYIYIYI